MAVINVTPDSFSDGGQVTSAEAAAARAVALVAAGAQALDLGGESTRPGAEPVSEDSESARVVPAIQAIRAAGVTVPITVDTSKGTVAQAALAAGADGINDVTAGADPELLAACAQARCPLILMHAKGDPRTMQRAPRYGGDVVGAVVATLTLAMERARAAGVAEHRILLDPGLGFGKTPGHNLALLRGLGLLDGLGRPLVVGLSRKSFLGRFASEAEPSRRDGLSHLLHAFIAPWCDWLRVHDPAGAQAALRLAADQP